MQTRSLSVCPTFLILVTVIWPELDPFFLPFGIFRRENYTWTCINLFLAHWLAAAASSIGQGGGTFCLLLCFLFFFSSSKHFKSTSTQSLITISALSRFVSLPLQFLLQSIGHFLLLLLLMANDCSLTQRAREQLSVDGDRQIVYARSRFFFFFFFFFSEVTLNFVIYLKLDWQAGSSGLNDDDRLQTVVDCCGLLWSFRPLIGVEHAN